MILDPTDGPVLMPCLVGLDCADCGRWVPPDGPVALVAPYQLVCADCANTYVRVGQRAEPGG